MTRPSIGARFVCTTKTDRKIPTRRDLFFSTSFSSTSTMATTVPSAAATIKFGSVGLARSGSRKNAIVQKKSSTKNQNAHTENNPKTIASTVSKAKIQRASQKAWKRIKKRIFEARKRLVKTAESKRNGLGLNHKMMGSATAPH